MDETECADTLDGAPMASDAASRPARARAEPSATAPVAARIGRYAILRRLGAGGMGVVFAAYDEQLDRKLAIKLLHRHGDDSRLQREAQGLARLSHPNVVQIYEIGEHEGAVFMAMEFVAGRTLGQWLQSPRSRVEILAAFDAAGRGLAAAHGVRLVHRDFKPDNVMIADDGRVKVMDFGLVRADGEPEPEPDPPASETEREAASGPAGDVVDTLERSASRSQLGEILTRTGSIMGTPAYMAPEQHRGQGTDARSDQFSFCVALWEALYGRRPFGGDTIGSLTYEVLHGEIAEPPRDADVPAWLRRVIERGLAREPEARWPSMDVLLAALARDPTRRRRWILGGLAVAVLGVGTWGGIALRQQQAEAAARVARQAAIESCEQRGDGFAAQAWSETRAQRARGAFAASKLAFAESAWTRSVERLDAYAAGLSSARAEVCVGAEVDGTIEASLADRMQRCLDERLARLDALASLLAEADDGRILRATSTTASLPLVRECTDPTSLARQIPWPDDPALRDRVRALHVAVAEVRARQTMGELDEALQQAEALVERATALGWAPMIAATTLLLGDLRDESADYARARTELEQAVYIAAKAGDDAVALDAVVELVHTVGIDLDEPEDGLRLARLAEILALRTDAQGSLIEASLRNNLGSLHQRSGDLPQALAAFEAALAIQSTLLPPEHPTLAITLNNIGTAHAEAGDLARALQFFERSLAIRVASYPAGHPRLATAHFNIGMTHAQRGEHEAARVSLERALELYRLNLPSDHPDIAFVLGGLASVDHNEGKYEAAAERYAEVLRIREARLPADHVDVASAHLRLGSALSSGGAPQRAIAHMQRAVEIYEANGPGARDALAKAWIELAEVQGELGDAEQVVASLQAAQRVAGEAGAEPLTLALVRWHLALVLWKSVPSRRAEAVEIMQACYLGYAAHGKPGDNDAVVAWLRARGAEVPALPKGHPTNVSGEER